MSVRRGRHDQLFRDATFADLAKLPIRLDAETDQQAWGPTALLAEKHRLTIYDAAYLELAIRSRPWITNSEQPHPREVFRCWESRAPDVRALRLLTLS
jgi:hypothetical protein